MPGITSAAPDARRGNCDDGDGNYLVRAADRTRNCGKFSLRAIGEIAGVVKVTRAAAIVDMGPPLGEETYGRDASITVSWLLVDDHRWPGGRRRRRGGGWGPHSRSLLLGISIVEVGEKAGNLWVVGTRARYPVRILDGRHSETPRL